jgi:aspartyl aminopeptidase
MSDDDALVPDFIDFLNESWTAFHAVGRVRRELREAGFVELDERKAWKLEKGGRYFFTRNHSTLCAFGVGAQYEAGNGMMMIGAHTDSPCPKLKPISRLSKSKHVMIGVQCYGGGLWSTWFDRDLGIAGRAMVRRDGGRLSHELVKINRAICRIPMLAVHLERGSGTKLTINKETHFAPVLATELKAALQAEKADKPEAAGGADRSDAASAGVRAQHDPLLLKILAEALGCAPKDIADFDLQLCDTQPSCIGGALSEFIFSGRLDNLAMCFMGTRALIDCTRDADLKDETSIRMLCMFDNEEVGSQSAHGAAAPILMDAVRRVTGAFAGPAPAPGLVERCVQSSFLVSADMAHAVHPNYAAKHEAKHSPQFHGGLVIKHNTNQRYATTAFTALMFKEFAARAEGGGCPVQEFVVRNDCGCGSTIGPIISGRTGLRTVDVGAPQWSMHSIREVMGTTDVGIGVRHFRSCYRHFTELNDSVQVDAVPAMSFCG